MYQSKTHQIDYDKVVKFYPDNSYELIIRGEIYHSDEFDINIAKYATRKEVLKIALQHFACISKNVNPLL
jgi:hypothetical protein